VATGLHDYVEPMTFHITTDLQPPVRLASGVAMAAKLDAHVDMPDLPYVLDVEVGVLHGDPICVSLRAQQRPGGPAVTRSGLNSIPVEQIVRFATAETAMSVSKQAEHNILRPLTPAEKAVEFRALQRPRGRRAEPGQQQLLVERAATMYRELTSSGVRHPKPVIATELSLSRSYVGALLGRARKQGLLATALKGRAGEMSEVDDEHAATTRRGQHQPIPDEGGNSVADQVPGARPGPSRGTQGEAPPWFYESVEGG
jgi:hypothetical protein